MRKPLVILKKGVLVWAVAMLVIPFAGTRTFAQSSGSFAGDFVSVAIIQTITCAADDPALSCTQGGSAFLGATIKMPAAQSKALLIAGSLQTNLLTSTSATGGKGNQTSTAMGSIVVRPEVTGPKGQDVPVFPPQVTFEERTQQLTANLSGCITNPDPTTGLPVITCTTPETISLLLSTMSAHSFNFFAQNVGAGVYTVKLHIGATATANTTSLGFNSKVDVGVGVGSLGVELVQVQTPFNSLCFDLVNGTSCP